MCAEYIFVAAEKNAADMFFLVATVLQRKPLGCVFNECFKKELLGVNLVDVDTLLCVIL